MVARMGSSVTDEGVGDVMDRRIYDPRKCFLSNKISTKLLAIVILNEGVSGDPTLDRGVVKHRLLLSTQASSLTHKQGAP